jgi:hypothetical protein
MDFKAARPYSGHVDVSSHVICHVCDVWQKGNLLRTDWEHWGCADDDRLKDGSQKWTEATIPKQRLTIEKVYGARASEFHRLPYWRTSLQVVVDPMHTVYLRTHQMFWRGPLGLENPSSPKGDQQDDEAVRPPASDISFHYPFVLPPPLSSIGSQDVEVEDEAAVSPLQALDWTGLPDDVRHWRSEQRKNLESQLTAGGAKSLKQISAIQKLLSQSKPDSLDRRAHLSKNLTKNKWQPLFYMCLVLLPVLPQEGKFEDLMGSSADKYQERVTKADMGDALTHWVS